MKAMLLAAGFGTRLQPITHATPKALLPFRNSTLIEMTLRRLARVGVAQAVINTHHLGQKICEWLGNDFEGMNLAYSHEPIILGTGGGLKNVESFFAGEQAFFLVNADIITNFDLQALLDRHLTSGAAATMALREDSRVGTDFRGVQLSDDRIIRVAGKPEPGPNERSPQTRDHLFCGIHVLSKEVFGHLPPAGKFSGINDDAYPSMISSGLPVSALVQNCLWSDIGTPLRYLRALKELLPKDEMSLGLKTDGPPLVTYDPHRNLATWRGAGETPYDNGILFGRGQFVAA